MTTYVLRRVLQVVPLLLAISALTFGLLQLAPGDFTSALAENPQISDATLERMRHAFGLDRPAWVQYLLYLRNAILHGDLGESFTYHQPVVQVLAGRLCNTLVLAIAAALVTWGLAVPLGVLAAVRQHKWVDRVLSLLAFATLSVPEVISGLVLLYAAARTGLLPIGGMHSIDAASMAPGARLLDLLRHLLLPAFVVGLVPLAGRMRQMRGSMLDVLRLDFVTTARAKGLPERTVVFRHALRNALNPMITLFGLTLGSLVSGALVAEVIFNWPGLGTVTLEAIQRQDPYLVLGAVLMAASVLVLANLVADLLLAVADPRIRHG
jgi:peptide/nickel transport system permease protein